MSTCVHPRLSAVHSYVIASQERKTDQENFSPFLYDGKMNTLGEPQIRVATPGDRDTLRRLYYAFHEFHVLGVPSHLRSLGSYETYDWAAFDKAIGEIFSNPDAVCAVTYALPGRNQGACPLASTPPPASRNP
jgi:hypothetical protein